MPHLQRDLVHGRTIIVAEERAARAFGEGLAPPQNLRETLGPLASDMPIANCPFCVGNEHETPPTVLTIPPNATTQALLPSSTWTARVFPNRFPAVTHDESRKVAGVERSETPARTAGGSLRSTPATLTDAEPTPARGLHEVLVHTARHATLGAQLSAAEWTRTFTMLQQRACTFRDAGWRWAALFQNVGAAAGASLAHLHAQLVALADLPDLPARELTAGKSRLERSGKCLWCEMLESELTSAARVVRESEKFLIFCPAASRLPYEMCILPKCHNSHFDTAVQADLDDLGGLWRGLVEVLEGLVPAYNWWIHSAPFDSQALGHYHWHIEVLPRSATLAGFEWSSGWHINTVRAEDAAAALRKSWPY